MFFIPLLLAGFFEFGINIAKAVSNDVIINEIQVAGNTADDEFIELHNVSDENIDLSAWSVQYKGGSATKYSKKNFPTGSKIKAHDYFLITHSSFSGSAVPDMRHSTFTLSSEKTGAGGTIFLVKSQKNLDEITPDSAIIDKVGYGVTYEYESFPAQKPEKNQSIERKNFVDTDNNHEDFGLLGTPSPQSSAPAEPEPEPEPIVYSNKILLNELLPAPSSGNDEYIELYNPTAEDIDISGYVLKDASKSGKYVFPEGSLVGTNNYLVVYKKDFKFALNNSGAESVTIFSPDEQVVSKVSYSGSKTNVSYNFDGVAWRWSKLLTPGTKNKFNNLPEVSKKKDNKIYANVYADFSAKGHDKDKDKLKFVWDFGDGHKSYKKETRHKFKKPGKYKVTLKVSDGSEDKIETFNIKVEKFPRSKVKIVSVSPNPKGKDSDNEYIVLQNKSKKKINLKDWSIATGSKKLYNHPILEDFIIEPGKSLRLTREFSKFSLNNKKSKVELRYPDGKVAHDFTYDKKKESVAEDEIYTKESGAWAWVAPKTETKLAVAEKANPIEVSPRVEEAPIILATSGKNFSENENLRKIVLANFTQPQGIVLGTATFKPTFSGASTIKNKHFYLEIIFANLNSIFNHFLNKIFLKLAP